MERLICGSINEDTTTLNLQNLKLELKVDYTGTNIRGSKSQRKKEFLEGIRQNLEIWRKKKKKKGNGETRGRKGSQKKRKERTTGKNGN